MESLKKLPPDRRLRAASVGIPPPRGTLPSLLSPSPAGGHPRRLSASLISEPITDPRSPGLSSITRQSPLRTSLDRPPLVSLSSSLDGKKSISARLSGGTSSASAVKRSSLPLQGSQQSSQPMSPVEHTRRRSHSTPLDDSPLTRSQVLASEPAPKPRMSRGSISNIDVFTKSASVPSEQRSRMLQEADTQQVFVILGNFSAVRPSLLHRSWVERDMGKVIRARVGMDLSGVEFARQCSVGSSAGDDPDVDPDDLQELLLQRPPDFIWANSRDELDTRTLRPTQIVNFFRNNTAITTQVRQHFYSFHHCHK